MIRLFFDIETVPGEETARRRIEAEIKPPGNISRPKRLREWEENEKPAKVEEEYRRTALNGLHGRILCIGYIKEEEGAAEEGVLSGQERDLLESFWRLAGDVDLFIGFNIFEFDFRFILQRSITQGVKPSRHLSFARYRSEPIYDVMAEWTLWGRETVSLDKLAQGLGIISPKGELDGSKVYDYYRAGRLDEIYEYCLRDVRATRAIYYRMNFLA